MLFRSHIVFLGSAIINRVLEYGIVATIGNDHTLYKDQFTDKSIVTKYRDLISSELGLQKTD